MATKVNTENNRSVRNYSNRLTQKDIASYFPNYMEDQDKLSELEEYDRDLCILADADVSIQFTNKGKDHAVLVMSRLFENAHRRVKIFARDFNGDISDNPLYLKNLRRFLEKDNETHVEVLFEGIPNPKSKALEILRLYSEKKKVSIRRPNETQLGLFRENLVNDEKMIHFAMADDEEKGFNKYRCETNTTNYIAFLNFDDTKFCKQLLNLYQILQKDAQSI